MLFEIIVCQENLRAMKTLMLDMHEMININIVIGIPSYFGTHTPTKTIEA